MSVGKPLAVYQVNNYILLLPEYSSWRLHRRTTIYIVHLPAVTMPSQTACVEFRKILIEYR